MGPDFSSIVTFLSGEMTTVIAAILAAGVVLVVWQLTLVGIRKIKAAVYWATDSAWSAGMISRGTRNSIQDRVRT